ncbi:Type 1 phosphatases regulator YPI1 [Smittium culicis]|uniref:Type 1 phosphatases regulator n=1 Tax=Smittium culicis TaxID=133412 RepID=A0A1R1XFJ3_9FUNG|nr:Type 1 phosphatases regulator YPI1 [Smittium culicis]
MNPNTLSIDALVPSHSLGTGEGIGPLVRPNNRDCRVRPGVSSQTRFRPSNPESEGSFTTTETEKSPREEEGDLVLYLTGVNSSSGAADEHQQESESSHQEYKRPKVRWAEDTVDNEHMGKKKSKVCCIFKKQRNWDESDTEDSDSSCCHSDEPNEYERMPRYK